MAERRRAKDAGTGAVLFDLDGTFADTAADMAAALNRQLARHDRPPLPLTAIRPHVSTGSRGLLAIGFDARPGDGEYETLRAEYLALYAEDLCRHTVPFPGIPDLLAELKRRGIGWGIVTNKPGWLTDPLLAAMAPDPAPACVVSGDTAARAKPHPDPLLHACALIGQAPVRCWYVGDDRRDIVAGRAAGFRTLAACYGYLGTECHPREWGADGLVHHPLEVLGWLERT
ncbi:MAG: HAD-IA family hydrolase [Thiohalocapsa sp.]|jgi:phosphoglycolate phosphatase